MIDKKAPVSTEVGAFCFCLTLITLSGTMFLVIVSFKSEEAARIWAGEVSRKLPQDIQRVALRKLEILHAATDVTDLRTPPGNRLEALKDDRRGQHSIRINDQWRICFVWRDSNAHDVDIADYH